jgi:hypothetical protein
MPQNAEEDVNQQELYCLWEYKMIQPFQFDSFLQSLT